MRFNRRRFLGLGAWGLGGGTLATALHFYLQQRTASHQPRPVLPPRFDATPAQAATPIASSTPLLRFAAVADAGSGDANQYAVGRAMAEAHRQQPFPFVIYAGDNIYPDGNMALIQSAFEQPYAELLRHKVRFQACLGNHDVGVDNGTPQTYYPGYHMEGQRYYTRLESGVEFFALETNLGVDWPTQLTWLDRQLSRSTAPWKIVFGHHPIYSSGRYGTNAAMVNALPPLFKKHGVQLYINGHEHHYERTQPIDGTTYLIVGTGGAQLRFVGKSTWTAHSASRYGFTHLTVYGDRIEVAAIATHNQRFDQGLIPFASA
jgi:hypothetical protein